MAGIFFTAEPPGKPRLENILGQIWRKLIDSLKDLDYISIVMGSHGRCLRSDKKASMRTSVAPVLVPCDLTMVNRQVSPQVVVRSSCQCCYISESPMDHSAMPCFIHTRSLGWGSISVLLRFYR